MNYGNKNKAKTNPNQTQSNPIYPELVEGTKPTCPELVEGTKPEHSPPRKIPSGFVIHERLIIIAGSDESC